MSIWITRKLEETGFPDRRSLSGHIEQIDLTLLSLMPVLVNDFAEPSNSTKRHSRLSREIHRHNLLPQKFRKRSRCNHGRIIGGKRTRWKEHRQSFSAGIPLKRRPQLLVRRHSSADKKRADVILSRRRQRFRNQIVNHRPLKRSHKIERLPIANRQHFLSRGFFNRSQRPPPSLNCRLQILCLHIAQDRRLNPAV